ncbi:hypothetical protein GCM10022210_23460 [Mucilaginibacter dorajii]|uniref:Uncharacterized protein n=1 Tax=Mucilaginibacter dorajii TaxID=692994 RepID=A0ABP7PWY7_9SPHI
MPEFVTLQLGEDLVFLNVIFEVDPKLNVAPLLLVSKNEVLVPEVIWHEELLVIPALKIPLFVMYDWLVPSLKVIIAPPATVNKAKLLLMIPQPVSKLILPPVMPTVPGEVLVNLLTLLVNFKSDDEDVKVPVLAKVQLLPGNVSVDPESKLIEPGLVLLKFTPLLVVPKLRGDAVAVIAPVLVNVEVLLVIVNGEVLSVIVPLLLIGDKVLPFINIGA